MIKKVINVGILGAGTVGNSTMLLLERNKDELERRLGRSIKVAAVAARTTGRITANTEGIDVGTNLQKVVEREDIDVIVEAIGGNSPAYELVMQAIKNKKHVVTANKALIAERGESIFKKAHEHNVMVAYEAAVGGGIPLIKSIREGLSVNRIEWLAGIINGTGNFILTEMRDKGRAFKDVLQEAQQLGYAEADPTFDVEGIDAAHKLTILASVAFGIPLQFYSCYIEGISAISRQDVNYARDLGYVIKHLGITKKTDNGIELRVHPTLIPRKKLIANVDGVLNAVLVKSDAVGPSLYCGAGAGGEPTASAVIADIIDVARGIENHINARVPSLGFHMDSLDNCPILPIEEIHSAYYLRMHVKDTTGVMAGITARLAQAGINIEAVIQKEAFDYKQKELVPVCLITAVVQEKVIDKAIAELEADDTVVEPIVRIRVDHLI